jgi:hypothetical protein
MARNTKRKERSYIDPSDIAGVMRDQKSVQSGQTANAGGGQGGAFQITAQATRFSVVATAGDSCKLPDADLGERFVVKNAGAAAMDVFPQSGDKINALATNAAFSVAAGKTCQFFCMVTGTWDTHLSA